MKLKKDLKETAAQLAGLQTIENVARVLQVKRKTAINYIYSLRKLGLVETSRGAGKKRLYKIYAARQPKKGTGLYAFISKNSKIKVVPRYEHYIYNNLNIEEAIVQAITRRDFRLILAVLGLFSKVTNWPWLNQLAKRAKAQRKVGALYELAKTIMRVRRVDKRTLNSLRIGTVKHKYIVDKLRSKDFAAIEKAWKVYIPFNQKDLQGYK